MHRQHSSKRGTPHLTHYSARLVYNNFPWPGGGAGGKDGGEDGISDKHRAAVEAAAEVVLAARKHHQDDEGGGGGGGGSGGATLADLYDPLTMPADLARAHATLDKAADRCYRRQPFPDERRRFEHLFALHEKLVHPLTAP